MCDNSISENRNDGLIKENRVVSPSNNQYCISEHIGKIKTKKR